MSEPNTVRRTRDLLIGRASIPGGVYFLTLCERARHARLTEAVASGVIREALNGLNDSTDFSLVAATIMPDHLHLLGRLGARLSLSRVIGKLKARSRASLSALNAGWQENFYEHRLRDSNELESVARYIFLNPYRAKLLPLESTWPLWWRWGEHRFEFEEMVAAEGAVPAQWIGEPEPLGMSDF